MATQVTGQTRARVRSLDPQVRYQFTVTPTNQISQRTPSTAWMTGSIADITGQPGTATTRQAPE